MKFFLEQISKVSVLKPTELEVLIALFHPATFKKHDFFAQAGEYPKKIGFVGSGILRAFYQNAKGEQYNKTFFQKGSFLGAYSALLTGQPNRIDIQCLTDCEMMVADYRAFTQLYDSYPRIERIARKLAESFFIQKEKREIDLVTLEAKERYQIFQKEHPELGQAIPQYHIASYLGITPTQLSRIRAQKT